VAGGTVQTVMEATDKLRARRRRRNLVTGLVLGLVAFGLYLLSILRHL